MSADELGPPPPEPRPRPRHRRRYLVVAGLLLAIVGFLVVIKFAQIRKLMGFGEHAAALGPPPEAVSTDVAELESWETTLTSVGSVAGVKSVTVSTEVPGIVSKIHFESGQAVRQGDVLVELDASPERAQLVSAKAQLDYAHINAARTRGLVDKGALPRQELDVDETSERTAQAAVTALEAQIDRKIIRAPFSGKLGIRAVNLGQYISPGTQITSLDSIGGAFVDFTLPQERLHDVHVGMPVRLALRTSTKPLAGTITAVDPTIDNASRSIRLRATAPDAAGALRPGMFVDVTVVMPQRAQVVTVPATAIVHASYGDSVFVIQNKLPYSPGMAVTPDGKIVKVVRQQIVRVGPARGDFVAIAQGLVPGEQVVTEGGFKLRNGAPVVVDNRVKPTASLEPHPENH